MPKYRPDQLEPLREDVRRRSTSQGRVFRREDLVAWGIPGDMVLVMQRRHWWTRLHHGVYADTRDVANTPDGRDTHLLHVAAAIRALPSPAYAFGMSAALIHGLAVPSGSMPPVNLVRPSGAEGRSLRRRITSRDRLPEPVVRTYPLTHDDLENVDGIPTVTRPLAAVSAAVRLSSDRILAMLDSAAWQQPDLIPAMHRHAEKLQSHAGIGEVRAALVDVRSGAQTPLESVSRLRLMRCGLPEPRLQVPFHDEIGLIGIVDMYFEDLGVIGEADGLMKYRTGEDLIREKRREDRLRRRHPVVRWDWSEIWASPATVAQRIHQAARGHER